MGFLADGFTVWIGLQGTCVGVHDGVAFFVFKGSIEEWEDKYGDILAFLVGDNVLVRCKDDYCPEVIKHELAHVRQKRKLGGELFFRPVYIASILKAWMLHGDVEKSPFEQEALKAEKEE